MLAESQGKKAAFLAECIRVLGLNAKVHAARAEKLRGGRGFDIVAMRAVDGMGNAILVGKELAKQTLALMIGAADKNRFESIAPEFAWEPPVVLPSSKRSILLLGNRLDVPRGTEPSSVVRG
jgi:16S rRNA G527 N7-methylase RsmG